ncbi:sensor histidine kinase [Paenibacillus sp. IHBB 3054]|uniref:sensor histidine kinase n=1 Tax=Paenibacillus sp. IHBB 3054 TaxID=3425689 RepID=UPI003F67E7AB
MKILANRNIKKLLLTFPIILLMFIGFGLFLVQNISDHYKKSMIEHDYNIAGYFVKNGSAPSQIAKAFTADKTSSKIQAGQEILQAAGYTADTQTRLLPEVQAFHRQCTVIFLVFSVLLSLILLIVLLLFLLRQDRMIEKANDDIRSFMEGDISMRLDDHEEGSLSQFFTSVNGMATSLTTHIDNEKHGREFLKDTISDISHQLKTPLAALKIYNEIIQDEQSGNEVVNEFVAKSERELNRIEVLIQNLLKLARLDTGSIVLEKGNHNVRDFLEDAIKSFRTRAELEEKIIRLDCDETAMMNFDQEWLLEAISNIIKNALEHTDVGSEIMIGCEKTPILTEIKIQDNGTGIHPEDIHSVFKRFYRSRFSKDKQGIGIGLTLSKVIVERHGGSITVESELGKGTTFRLAFPMLSKL